MSPLPRQGIWRLPHTRCFSGKGTTALAHPTTVEEPLPKPGDPTELLVIIPDKPNVLARRIAIRPRHSPNFVRLHNEGYVSWAGPLFEKHVGAEAPQRPFKGSAMVVNEASREAFERKVASDVYVQEGIWDIKKAQVLSFRTTMRWQRQV